MLNKDTDGKVQLKPTKAIYKRTGKTVQDKNSEYSQSITEYISQSLSTNLERDDYNKIVFQGL